MPVEMNNLGVQHECKPSIGKNVLGVHASTTTGNVNWITAIACDGMIYLDAECKATHCRVLKPSVEMCELFNSRVLAQGPAFVGHPVRHEFYHVADYGTIRSASQVEIGNKSTIYGIFW
ncbi:MAG TPA: hypothetical protein DCM28_21265 [Phycisphaerales bacterium]|nr:hypothetical protein [Phycisphaerales bacterium]HCD31386.1 hypothetical protein [Phycisphaerales bacterium]|tara:strand:+ start:676 stop:1032 length:357 start_codon:yes stop_codon:yes gene_type:complete